MSARDLIWLACIVKGTSAFELKSISVDASGHKIRLVEVDDLFSHSNIYENMIHAYTQTEVASNIIKKWNFNINSYYSH